MKTPLRYPLIEGLPIRPRPHPREGLLAYCWRVCSQNGMPLPRSFSPRELCSEDRPREKSAAAQLIGLDLAVEIWERERAWFRGVYRHPPRWPIRCPVCMAEHGVHYAVFDVPRMAACPIHNCQLIRHCPECGRRQGLRITDPACVCQCGAKLGDLTVVRADHASALFAHLVAASEEHQFGPGLAYPVARFGYRAAELISILSWATVTYGSLSAPPPFDRRPVFHDERIPRREWASAWILRLVMRLPAVIPEKLRRLQRFVCRPHGGPLVIWRAEPPVQRISGLLLAQKSAEGPLSQTVIQLLSTGLDELTVSLPGLVGCCYHPRLSAADVSHLLERFTAWWSVISRYVPELPEWAEFPRRTEVDLKLDMPNESGVVGVMNLLFAAADRNMPPDAFRVLATRWRLPSSIRHSSVTAADMVAYFRSLREVEQRYFSNLLNLCIDGDADHSRSMDSES